MLKIGALATFRSGPALRRRDPSASWGKINRFNWKPPVASIRIDGTEIGIPWSQDSLTTAPTGNPVPITVVTVPRGPTVGNNLMAALAQGIWNKPLAESGV